MIDSSLNGLDEQEPIYRSLLDSLPLCVLRKDRSGRFTYVNQPFCVLLGRDGTQILGKTDFDFYPPALARKYREDDNRVLACGEVLESIEEHATPDGRLRFVEVIKTPVRDASGQLTGIQTVFWDVTTRHTAEDQLRETYALLENAVEGICRVDSSGRLLTVNRAFAVMIGCPVEQLLNRPWLEHIHCEDRAVLERLSATIAADSKLDLEARVLRRDGETFHAELVLMRAPEKGGKPTGLYIFVKDVTERKRAEQQLLETERFAAIGQMVTGVAHESRNALQEILACCRMLEWEFESNQEAMQLVADLHSAYERLYRLLESLRAYAAPLQLERRRCCLRSMVLQAWERLADHRQNKQVELREQGTDAELVCLADPRQMERVFEHILENGLSWCSQPGILEIRYASQTRECRPMLEVAICDNGPGLTDEQQEKIFQPFYTTKMQGAGLGMAIAKRIVDAHQGCIEVHARDSGGTEIIIQVPREST